MNVKTKKMMNEAFTGIILAGGESRRFNGTKKSDLVVGNKRIIEHTMSLFNELFPSIILVTNNPKHYINWDVTITRDIVAQRSSLTGIHAGLFFTTTPYAFVSACDTPFLKKEIIQTIIENVEPDSDVVIPQTTAGLEPLCAAYAITCLPFVQRELDQNRFKIQGFFSKVTVKTVNEALLKKNDSRLLSFFNINTPEDLKTAAKLEEERKQ
jgi:molybdopterin-guanine dinucleotide biosynthesis protein A